MSATLRLTREGFEVELRRGTFHVLLDGDDIRSIERHETLEDWIEHGHHTLRIKAGRYSSEARSFDAAHGEIVNFRCHGAMVWPRYVASIVKPDLAISLKRQ
jgi:hypothetical protein